MSVAHAQPRWVDGEGGVVTRRWKIMLALALGSAIAAAALSAGMSYWVPFEPNLDRFDSAASFSVANAHGEGTWVEVGLPWRLGWLTKGRRSAVFVHRGHRFVFFTQVEEEPNFVGGYLYSVDGTSPSAILEEGSSAPMLAPRWWIGTLSQEFLAGG
jgi:hypothetical protein